jgi:hypothetical protein
MWNPRNFKGQVLPTPTQKNKTLNYFQTKQSPELLPNKTKPRIASKQNKAPNAAARYLPTSCCRWSGIISPCTLHFITPSSAAAHRFSLRRISKRYSVHFHSFSASQASAGSPFSNKATQSTFWHGDTRQLHFSPKTC